MVSTKNQSLDCAFRNVSEAAYCLNLISLGLKSAEITDLPIDACKAIANFQQQVCISIFNEIDSKEISPEIKSEVITIMQGGKRKAKN